MNSTPEQISNTARRAARARDWATVDICAREILAQDTNSAEGFFLTGLVEKVSNHPKKSADAFARALQIDAGRYDAAIELAAQYTVSQRNTEAVDLLDRYRSKLGNSPRYLDMAATTYTNIGLPERAWPLYKKASELQTEADLFRANLAACSVYFGKIEEAGELYRGLLAKNPNHQRNHYYLSRLARAKNADHVEQMKNILNSTNQSPDKNVFIYYALGKELEDLSRWDEAFEYYKKAGDAVTGVANYNIRSDEKLIDTVIDICTGKWLVQNATQDSTDAREKSPLFILGLPRTGTTLTERIISSHSQVHSVGETQYLEMAVRTVSGVQSRERMNLEMLEALRTKDVVPIADEYYRLVEYLLGEEPMFVEKLPYNFLYLGFIVKAFPQAKIVHLKRNPMDACFAMYKQVFTHVFKFSYSLENLGRYYVAYDRLIRHWRTVLGDRLIEVEYEAIVADQERETRFLLDKIGLPFEQACLEFNMNRAPSATASSVQVREKIHTQSVNKWKNFASQLQPLKNQLEMAGIAVD